MRVFVLLATYRGTAYLPQLLESLRRQSLEDWRLLVRDDGSPDATLDMLHAAAAEDKRIEVLSDTRGNLGACGNFALLMEEAHSRQADYVFFADQDDVWLPEKLAMQLDCISRLESQHGAHTPLVVHSDAVVVDQQLEPLHPSLKRHGRLPFDLQQPLRLLLLYNNVLGCATVVNRALLKAALPVPASAVMHDWWVGLCGAALGHTGYMDAPTLLYRQHGSNAFGASSFLQKINPFRTGWSTAWRKSCDVLAQSIEQARSLRELLHQHNGATRESTELVGRYVALFDAPLSAGQRYRELRRAGMAGYDLFRRLSLLLRLRRIAQLPRTAEDSRAKASRERPQRSTPRRAA